MSFIAAIRRTTGGVFAKAPKSNSMTAVPVHTSQSNLFNLFTYFDPWPKRRSKFLLYGPSARGFCSLPGDPSSASHLSPPQGGNPGSAGEVEEHLYGPALVQQAPPTSRDAKEGAGAAPTVAAAAAKAAAAAAAASKPLGIAGLLRRFKKGQKLVMVTAYDFPSARFARGADLDLVLVGDSLGNCRLGLPDTVGVTMTDMLGATRAVRRGLEAPVAPSSSAVGNPGPKPVLVGDMPFGSYLMEADALKNAAAFRMAGADMVKLEGGRVQAPLARTLTEAGIPVMGHIGLQPQSASLQGGLRLQGTTAESAQRLVDDAKELASAGILSLVVECVPIEVGAAIQAAVPDVPVIGIGAGGAVAGQVLVCDDFLGLHGKPPSFVKMYDDLASSSARAYAGFTSDVRTGDFPGTTYARNMKAAEVDKFLQTVPAGPIRDAVSAALPPPEGPSKSSPAARMEELAMQARLSTSHSAPQVMSLEYVAGRMVQPRRHAVTARAMSVVPAYSQQIEVLSDVNQMRAWRSSRGSRRVAFVPTMGNLHEGHLELVDEAKKYADDVLVSIYVNSAQFAAHEDLNKYPRTMARDLELLQARGVCAVFTPGEADIYPRGSPGGTLVEPRFVEGKSEAACRPHFFTGVATVCLKLFNLCRPDVVVFGQKDAMQCVVISRMLEDLLLDTQISMIVAPTSREADGVARSSRNSYLTPQMRQRAPAIYAALVDATHTSGASPGSVRRAVREALEGEGMVVSYVSVAEGSDMAERDDSDPLPNSVVSVACLVRDGEVECRLIDCVVVPSD